MARIPTRRPANGKLPPAPSRQNLPAAARGLIANVHNDITVPMFSGRLRHQDETLIQRGGGRGLRIYDDVERDPRAFAALQKRKKTLLGRDWIVEATGEDARDIAAAELSRRCSAGCPST